jgi:hypothetical protein
MVNKIWFEVGSMDMFWMKKYGHTFGYNIRSQIVKKAKKEKEEQQREQKIETAKENVAEKLSDLKYDLENRLEAVKDNITGITIDNTAIRTKFNKHSGLLLFLSLFLAIGFLVRFY